MPTLLLLLAVLLPVPAVRVTLAFTPERVPLGLLAQDVWVRDREKVGQRATRRQRAIAEKESGKWLRSVAAVNEARHECPATHYISGY